MTTEKRKAAICIGVGDAKPLPYLAGAINGARAFHDWATTLGYESKLLIDDPDPVTLTRLRTAIEAMLRPGIEPIHRLVLYFAGHGLIREAEEGLWLLSDWYGELRAVAVEGLRRRLYLYNIKQISIFADACRKLPSDVQASDLTADAVLGRGPVAPSITPAIDKFIAAQDGTESYAVPGATPETDRCIFSGVLMEGLWGTKKTAFSQIVQNKITSRSLGAFLQTEVPERAKYYKRKLDPSVSPSFPEGDDIYFGDRAVPTPPTFPEWPPPESLKRMGPEFDGEPDADVHADGDEVRLEPFVRNFGFARSFEFGIPETIRRKVRKAQKSATPSVRKWLGKKPTPESFKTQSGFGVEGAAIRSIWTATAVFAEPQGEADWWCIRQQGHQVLQEPAPLLIEFADDLFAAPTMMPRFVAAITRGPRGVSSLIYREIYSPAATVEMAEEAISRLESGALRSDAATDFAVKLRQWKHIDPVLGVISAYLYDSIGDVENIRRMAYYYIEHGQPIPYDIALLAQVEAEWRDGLLRIQIPPVSKRKPRTKAERKYGWTHSATPYATGVVGGFWPWMRQGWTFLDDPLDSESKLIVPGLPDLTQYLKPARFATFDAQGARKLAGLFGLKPKP